MMLSKVVFFGGAVGILFSMPHIVKAELPYGPDTCIQGYVWREAVPKDHVCVRPEIREQAKRDNVQANTRKQPGGGAYGPDTCIQGYVWREAVPGDHVCVRPEIREQAKKDNAQAEARFARNPTISYLGNYPSDKWGRWTEGLQGVGNNNDSWFFTQREVLWKVPLRINLNNSKNIWPGRSNFPGVLRVEMPEVLRREGFNHFGDLDALNGYIFIPVERSGKTPAIAVFRENDLSFVSYALLKNKTRSGWCSIAPNGQLFTSHNKIDSKNPINIYEIDWKTLRNQGKLNLQLVRNFYLTGIPKEYGGDLSQFIQGGDFSTDGKYLFIMNGKVINPKKLGEEKTHDKGIWMFKNDNYKRGVFVTKSVQHGHFQYEYKPALLQEPEGITYWDIDSSGSPGKGGQLHAILLNVRPRRTDSIWFKHYRLR